MTKQFKLYGTERWRRRAALQMKLEPLCRVCLARGEVKAAEVAHHTTPHKGDAKLFWTGEIVSVCKACHDGIVQQEEKRGFHCAIGVDGFPLDKKHRFYATK
jgi:hypothetical protein